MVRCPGKRWIAGGILILVFAGVLFAYLQARWTRDRTDPHRARLHDRPIPVRTALATESQVDTVIGATALTHPSHTAVVKVSPNHDLSVTGPVADIVVKTVHVHEGDQVHRGQVLFELEGDVLKQILKQREKDFDAAKLDLDRANLLAFLNARGRELNLLSAEINLKFRQEDLEIRKVEFEVLDKLVQARAARDFEYYEAKSRFARARFELSEARHRLQLAQDAMKSGALHDKYEIARTASAQEAAANALDLARRNVDKCQIRSVLDGFVSRVELVPGQVVGVGAALTEVFQLDPIHVRVDFPQERIDEVALGQKAEIVLDSFPKETFTGTVIRIAPQANPQLRVLPVVLEVPNPQHRIKAGINGYVRIKIHKSGLTVPALAVLQRNNKAVVFRIQDGKAQLREVRTGHLLDTGVMEVHDGLAPGDEVVVFHNFYRHADQLADDHGYLRDQDLVDVDWRKWARRD
jgi:multidrug efflux pump subunit AcrA (membrane-fusion protein)